MFVFPLFELIVNIFYQLVLPFDVNSLLSKGAAFGDTNNEWILNNHEEP